MGFQAFTSHGGTTFGGLLDPTSTSVTLSGFTYGEEAGWEWFTRAVANHKETLDVYARLLRDAGGDVTDERVKRAASALHGSVASLPIGHAAYAGVGFASPDHERVTGPAAALEDEPATPRPDADRLHPLLDTALRGNRQQRLDLAGQAELPIEVELILARDPEQMVRSQFVSNGTRSRSAMLLMERDEVDDDVRRELSGQRFASPSLKLDVPLADLYWESLEGVADLLGLDDDVRAGLIAARDRADYLDPAAPTVRQVLESLGWTD